MSGSSDAAPGAELVFLMGQFEAKFPVDRLYARNHMWAQVSSSERENLDGALWEGEAPAEPIAIGSAGASPSQKSLPTIRFGFSAYAVRLLQDVYFLDWCIDPGSTLKEKQQIGSIESKKAESDLFAPLAGTLMRLNEALLGDPAAINVDKYGSGWLFEIEGQPVGLLSPEQYLEHLASVWEVTQRTIKGQMNE